MKKKNKNDIIPVFLKFRIRKNEVFSEEAVHSFQLKLLRKEKSRAEKGLKLFEKKHGEEKDILRKDLKKRCSPSIMYSVRMEMRNQSKFFCNLFNDMLTKLSERQDRSLRNGSHNNVVTIDGVELPKLVLNVLSSGPKRPFREKFKEVHFLAHVDNLVRELREKNTDGEQLCEIELSAK